MSKKDRMCTYHEEAYGDSAENRASAHHLVFSKKEVPRKRVTCPVCKRRLTAKVSIGYDDVVRYLVPQHKRKRWWRK